MVRSFTEIRETSRGAHWEAGWTCYVWDAQVERWRHLFECLHLEFREEVETGSIDFSTYRWYLSTEMDERTKGASIKKRGEKRVLGLGLLTSRGVGCNQKPAKQTEKTWLVRENKNWENVEPLKSKAGEGSSRNKNGHITADLTGGKI